jgi:hypothetical protein
MYGHRMDQDVGVSTPRSDISSSRSAGWEYRLYVSDFVSGVAGFQNPHREVHSISYFATR